MPLSSSDPAPEKNGRYAFTLFTIYFVLFVGFVGLSAFRSDLMGTITPIGGLNLAVVYGMGLILAAIVLAFLYLLLNRVRS